MKNRMLMVSLVLALLVLPAAAQNAPDKSGFQGHFIGMGCMQGSDPVGLEISVANDTVVLSKVMGGGEVVPTHLEGTPKYASEDGASVMYVAFKADSMNRTFAMRLLPHDAASIYGNGIMVGKDGTRYPMPKLGFFKVEPGDTLEHLFAVLKDECKDSK